MYGVMVRLLLRYSSDYADLREDLCLDVDACTVDIVYSRVRQTWFCNPLYVLDSLLWYRLITVDQFTNSSSFLPCVPGICVSLTWLHHFEVSRRGTSTEFIYDMIHSSKLDGKLFQSLESLK